MSAQDCPDVVSVLVARASDQNVIAQYTVKGAVDQERQNFQAAFVRVLQKASKLPAYPGWRETLAVGDKLDDHNGHVHALADKQALCVVAVAIRGRGYPDRLVQGLLQELAEKVRSSATDEQLSEAKAGQLNGTLKNLMKAVVKSHSDPSKLDRVTEVHEKVDRVKSLMHENVKRILETHVSLDNLQTKSSSMSVSADQFLKQSVSLKRQVQLRNLRVKIMVAGCSCALAAYLLMPLFSQ